MKVLFVNARYYPNIIGGAERSAQVLAEAMARNGCQPVVVSAGPDQGIRISHYNGVKVYYMGIKDLYSPVRNRKHSIIRQPFWNIVDVYNPMMGNKVGKIIDAECPDIVHTHNVRGFSVAVWHAAKRRNLPIVHTLHDYYLLCLRSIMFLRGKNCSSQCYHCAGYTFLRKRMSNLVDAVVGVSRFILHRHLNLGYFRQAKIREVVFGANPSSIRSAVRPFEKSGPLCLGFLGRLKKGKGIEVLLEVVKKLPGNEYQLWIAGKGTETEERSLKGRYKAENINFLGFVEPVMLFNRIDILVVPSLWNEPLGRVVHEAYAHGVPVVASNMGGSPEMIEHGKTGFVFDSDRPEELSALLVKIKENPDMLVGMRKAGIKKSQEFLPERLLSRYLRISQAAIRQNTWIRGNNMKKHHGLLEREDVDRKDR